MTMKRKSWQDYQKEIAARAKKRLVNAVTGEPLKVVEHIGCHYAKIFPKSGIGGSEFPYVLAGMVESWGGECMSCRPRCPRGNTPGYVIQALRTLSQKLGFFVESEKGRQQLALKRIIGENILRTGYCIVPRLVKPELHPEQGTVWKWIYDNDKEIYGQFTPVYMRHGAGALRRLDEESLAEINEIFKVSGGSEMFDTIEQHSDRKAREMGYEEGADQQYMMDVFLSNSNEHY